ncbi:MAG: exonuclease domain-containing protein [Myxococcales bacterium]|nr:exonuclease domain-containing protein [Myxococcales bacterium]
MRWSSDHAGGTTIDETHAELVVLDFEATCRPGGAPQPQEIIEFPSVLVDLEAGRVIDEFSTFVRPVHHPRLGEFCTELTSIRQEDVERAATFPEVLRRHQRWLEGHGLLPDAEGAAPRFVFATCGDWDLATMLPTQCAASGLSIAALPRPYRRWTNIKKIFAQLTGRTKGQGMPAMLRHLGLALEGRHHRGIDDCRNIARIALALHERGASFRPTSQLAASRYPPLPLELQRGELVHSAVLHKRAVGTLLGLARSLFRTNIIAVHTLAGQAITRDEALMELQPGTRLRALTGADLNRLRDDA